MFETIKRLLQVWRILAMYRMDTMLANQRGWLPRLIALAIALHYKAWFSKFKNNPMALRFAFEDLGVLAIKLGQLLSTRRDLLPPEVIYPLSFLQDRVRPFDVEQLRQIIEKDLGQPISQLFDDFSALPLAAASIAQVHTARLKTGEQVVVKVVRPGIKAQIERDFAILQYLVAKFSGYVTALQAVDALTIVQDYRKTILAELDLRKEAANARKFRANFANSNALYVPEVFADSVNIMVSERIYGVPVNEIAQIDAAGIDRAALAKSGLTTFFTQVFRDNFFHADMHPGNVFVDISHPDSAKFISLDCAIVGVLSEQDRLTVARLLLAVMQQQFDVLIDVAKQAMWIPDGVDLVALTLDAKVIVSPMIEKPMHELDFAGILMQIMDMARQYRLKMPPQLVLLLKTLVHVEGLGRDLYPNLDIWQLAKPILSEWVAHKMHPLNVLKDLRAQAPDMALTAVELPQLVMQSLHSLRQQPLLLKQLAERQQQQIQMQTNALQRQRKVDWVFVSSGLLVLAVLAGVQWPVIIGAVVMVGLRLLF